MGLQSTIHLRGWIASGCDGGVGEGRRSAERHQARLDVGWQIRSIQPLSFGEVQEFVGRWYSKQDSVGAALWRVQALSAALARDANIWAMARNPLLLTMMAHLFDQKGELSASRATVLEGTISLFFEPWSESRNDPA